jgi:hypothetical protein
VEKTTLNVVLVPGCRPFALKLGTMQSSLSRAFQRHIVRPENIGQELTIFFGGEFPDCELIGSG